MAWVQALVKSHRLGDRINWQKVELVLKGKTGIAQDVTKVEAKPRELTVSGSREPRQLGLFPLQSEKARLE